MSPAMGDLFPESLALRFVQLWNVFDCMRTLGDESSFTKQRQDVGEVILCSIVVDILEHLLSWDSHERVANSVVRLVRCTWYI